MNSLGQLTNSQAPLSPFWGHGEHLDTPEFLKDASYLCFMQLFTKYQASPVLQAW